MIDYTISVNGASPVKPAEKHLSNLRLSKRNQEPDSLSAEVASIDALTSTPFSYADHISLFADGNRIFSGHLRTNPRQGTPQTETQQLEILGPWHELDNLIYRDNWLIYSEPDDPDSETETLLRARPIVGLEFTGQDNDEPTQIDSKAALTRILSYAVTRIPHLDVGEIKIPSQKIPFLEFDRISCAEAIRAILRWHRLATVSFDYSGTGPVKINILDDDEATTKTWTIGQQPLSAIPTITPRHDLVRPAVYILYIRQSRDPGAEGRIEHIVDKFPTDATGDEIGCLHYDTELAGAVSQSSYLSQSVKAQLLPDLDFTDPIEDDSDSRFRWWLEHYPIFRAGNVKLISVEDSHREPSDEEDEDPSSMYPRELLEGNIAPWMGDLRERRERMTCIAEIEVTDPETDQIIIQTKEVSVEVTTTNAITRKYTALQSSQFTPAEDPPEGLAEHLYKQSAKLHYEGNITLIAQDPDFSVTAAHRLNLAGGPSAWETMRAHIQSVDHILDGGQTDITFGPPEHLGPQDLIELHRAERGKLPTISYRRATAQPSEEEADLPEDYSPLSTSESSIATSLRTFDVTLSTAGILPTEEDLRDAITSAYNTEIHPRNADHIRLKKDGRVVIIFDITSAELEVDDNLFTLSFEQDGETWYAEGFQLGLY